jgi:hypothetical protein
MAVAGKRQGCDYLKTENATLKKMIALLENSDNP